MSSIASGPLTTDNGLAAKPRLKNGRAGGWRTSIGKLHSKKTEMAPSMPGESSRQVLRQLNTLFQCGVAGPLSDEELLIEPVQQHRYRSAQMRHDETDLRITGWNLARDHVPDEHRVLDGVADRARKPQSLITGEHTPVTEGCTNRIVPRRFISAKIGSNFASAIERPDTRCSY